MAIIYFIEEEVNLKSSTDMISNKIKHSNIYSDKWENYQYEKDYLTTDRTLRSRTRRSWNV